SPPGRRGRATLTRSVSEGCRKSVAARRQRPRSRFGLVCRTTQAAELDQHKPNFLVVFSEKCRQKATGVRSRGGRGLRRQAAGVNSDPGGRGQDENEPQQG